MNIKPFLTPLWLAALAAFGCLPAVAKDSAVPQKFAFTTADGVRIVGVYRAPSAGKKTVVLLHGLGSNKEEWGSFEKLLAGEGYGYYAYDARGHGESVKTASGSTLNYKEFGRPGPGSPWNAMVNDLGDAVAALSAGKKIPQQRIAVAGASLGANVALTYAATHPAVPLIVLFSPGLNYAGIETVKPLRSMKVRPLLIAASPDDTYAWQSSEVLSRTAPYARFLLGPGGHGVQMFNGTFEKQVLITMERLAASDGK